MFSKLWELAGAALIGVAIAYWATWEAGMLFGGIFLLATGSTLDDAAVSARIRRGFAWVNYAYQRQMIRERGGYVPSLRQKSRVGQVACGCGGDPDCPICDGRGTVPDPHARTNGSSPHPPIKVNPQAQSLADQLARQRQERAKVGDRTPALTRYSPADDLERLA